MIALNLAPPAARAITAVASVLLQRWSVSPFCRCALCCAALCAGLQTGLWYFFFYLFIFLVPGVSDEKSRYPLLCARLNRVMRPCLQACVSVCHFTVEGASLSAYYKFFF